MHQSRDGSWQAVKISKGNHRRKEFLAKNSLGGIGKTYITPSGNEGSLYTASIYKLIYFLWGIMHV